MRRSDMDHSTVIRVSLETLLDRVLRGKCIDDAAVKAFCGLVLKEPAAAEIAVDLIIEKLYSLKEHDILGALEVADYCAEHGGIEFREEVMKFKFLNELLKLCSAEHRMHSVSSAVHDRVIKIFALWSNRYPNETKIKEALKLMEKQLFHGEPVCKEGHGSFVKDCAHCMNRIVEAKSDVKHKYNLTKDEVEAQVLRKLLQSKDPTDLDVANVLIRNMVNEKEMKEKEEEKTFSDINTLRNSVSLLSEMLSTCSNNGVGETEVITELYDACVRLRPVLTNLLSSNVGNISLVSYEDLLDLDKDVGTTLKRYEDLFYVFGTLPLLDFESPAPSANVSVRNAPKPTDDTWSSLQEVFGSNSNSVPQCSGSVDLMSDTTEGTADSVPSLRSLAKKTFLRNKTNESVSNGGSNKSLAHHSRDALLDLDNGVIEQAKDYFKNDDSAGTSMANCVAKARVDENNGKDGVPLLGTEKRSSPSPLGDVTVPLLGTEKRSLPSQLGDITVPLEQVTVPPKREEVFLLNEDDGITMTLVLTSNKPKTGVSVYLLSTISKNRRPISNFVFQPIKPEGCQIKLQPQSKSSLPAYNPHIPSETILQVMLVASPGGQDKVPLNFMISYMLDREVRSEFGNIALPLRSDIT